MRCPSCNADIPSGAKFCPACGYTVNSNTNSTADANTTYNSQNYNQYNNNKPIHNLKNSYSSFGGTSKSPVLAVILSLLIVGLGQLYLGKTGKGIMMFLLAAFFGLFSFGLLWFAVAAWSAIDAYQTAKNT